MSLNTASTTVTSMGNNDYVKGLLINGYRWTDPTIHYNFDSGFSDAMRSGIFRAALKWSDVANINFDPTNAGNSEIYFQAATDNLLAHYGYSGTPYLAQAKVDETFRSRMPDSSGAFQNTTYRVADLGRVHTHFATDSPAVNNGVNPGQQGFEVFVHEIGHALGLKHPFDSSDGVNTSYFPGIDVTKKDPAHQFGDNRLNQGVYTVMSYNTHYDPGAKNLDYSGNIAGPMAFDIAAIQQLYGARKDANENATFYQLYDSTAPASNMGWQSIWDTSGLGDTIGYGGSFNAVINLRPATLDDSFTGGGMMSYTWRLGAGGRHIRTSQGYTIAGDATGALHNQGGFQGVLIEKARGGSGTDLLTGNDGANQLWGNEGNDTIIGGLGNDTLIGGAGIDVMKGGAGDDIYNVDNPNDTYSEMNFRHRDSGGTDVVQTTITHFTLAENSRSQIENLTYTGALSFSGVGNSLNNVIIGGRANDTLTGGIGNDTLDGLAGADNMSGGEGDDTYFVDSVEDFVDESNDGGDAGGIDTIKTSRSFYTLDDNPDSKIENLTLLSTDGAGGVGNALNNTITGNSGDDFLQGNDGDDTLIGLGGRDSLIGGNGNDTYVISDPAAIIVEDAGGTGGVDLVQTRLTSYTLTDGVENLTFADFSFRQRAHTGVGNALNNAIRGGTLSDRLIGNDGDDYLYGNGGKDTLLGDAGNDTLRGGAGDDVLNGGAGSDTADYHDTGNKTDINLSLGIAKVLKSDAETDTLISIENIIGSKGADKVVGDDEDNAFIYQGWYGRLSSSGGADTFDGAGGSDTIDFSSFSVQMMTIDLGAGTAMGKYSVDSASGTKNGSKTVVSFSHVENVVSSRGDDTIIGDGADNTFVDAGAYRYQHESGGFDTYAGGKGDDTVDFSRYDSKIYLDLENGEVDASYHVSLVGGGEASGIALVARVSDIENIVAGLDSDTLKGDASDNVFYYAGAFTADIAAGGSDDYDGRGGSNTIDMSKFHGMTDIDLGDGIVTGSYQYDTGEGPGTATTQLATLTNVENAVGSAQADTIEGSAAANEISGGASGDRITGNEGSDRLTGGSGIDTFVFGVGFGHDQITDFITLSGHRGSHDVLEFSTSVFADWDHVLAATEDTDAGAVITLDDDNTITLTGVTKQSLSTHHETDVIFV